MAYNNDAMKNLTAAIIGILLNLFVVAFIVWLTLTVRTNRAVKTEMVSLYEVAVWELIRREGISLEAYRCPAGHRTIGIGRRDEERDTLTLDEARRLLAEDLQIRYDKITELLPTHTRNERMAVTLLVYNLGLTRVLQSEQWQRIVQRSPDVEEMWLKYRYYQSGGQWKESDNLRKARELEVLMWRGDADALRIVHDSLKLQAINSYSKA